MEGSTVLVAIALTEHLDVEVIIAGAPQNLPQIGCLATWEAARRAPPPSAFILCSEPVP